VATAVLVLRLRPVDEQGTVLDWKGRAISPEDEGVVCLDGVRIVGSMDWEWSYDDMVSIENLWVDPEYRSTPRVLLMVVRHFKERCPDAQVTVGEYANSKTKRLVQALNR
jgi:hypothetical protein